MFKKLFFLCLISALPVFAGEISVVDGQNFDQEVKSGVVLVDFYSPWCGPCKRLSPVLDGLADKLKRGQKIVKVNMDKSNDLAQRFGISAVPTLILLKNGQEVDRMQGFVGEQTIVEFMNSAN